LAALIVFCAAGLGALTKGRRWLAAAADAAGALTIATIKR